MTIETLKERVNRMGRALGRPDIASDSIDFYYLDEAFNFPCLEVMPLCRPEGTFYTAKVADLRKLRKSNGRHANR